MDNLECLFEFFHELAPSCDDLRVHEYKNAHRHNIEQVSPEISRVCKFIDDLEQIIGETDERENRNCDRIPVELVLEEYFNDAQESEAQVQNYFGYCHAIFYVRVMCIV